MLGLRQTRPSIYTQNKELTRHYEVDGIKVFIFVYQSWEPPSPPRTFQRVSTKVNILDRKQMLL